MITTNAFICDTNMFAIETYDFLSIYRNDCYIQVAAVQLYKREHQSYHQLPRNKDNTAKVERKTTQSICGEIWKGLHCGEKLAYL